MPIKLVEKPDIRLEIPSTNSEYPMLGRQYSMRVNGIIYSKRLARATDMHFYDIQENMPDDIRMSTAYEELAIQKEIAKTGQDPRQAEAFAEVVVRDWRKQTHFLQWTSTGLRVPKNLSLDKYETDGQGRRSYPRIVLIGGQEVGEILVPKGCGKLVVEWDPVFGIPTRTLESRMEPVAHTAHFLFDPKPKVDELTGYRDVAVVLFSCGCSHYPYHCLMLEAGINRLDKLRLPGESLHSSFRPVQGSLVLPDTREFSPYDEHMLKRSAYQPGLDDASKN